MPHSSLAHVSLVFVRKRFWFLTHLPFTYCLPPLWRFCHLTVRRHCGYSFCPRFFGLFFPSTCYAEFFFLFIRNHPFIPERTAATGGYIISDGGILGF